MIDLNIIRTILVGIAIISGTIAIILLAIYYWTTKIRSVSKYKVNDILYKIEIALFKRYRKIFYTLVGVQVFNLVAYVIYRIYTAI